MATTVIIWDRFIRSYHWIVAVVFALNYFILEPGEQVHQWLGYSAAGLILLRLVWGIIGPKRARFSDFWPTPRRIASHIAQLKQRQIPSSEGHNPIGAIAIFLFWLLFLAQATTGFLLEETDRFFGSSRVEDIHEIFAHSLFALVIVHISAVILVGWWGRISLIRPMLTGKRKINGG